ncbi:MAG: DotA/TraY family protein [Alphaproteobacteria bacterium]|nr:DotA/TraY family protein [Alphaproteobacteria bacterium]
MTLRQVIGIAYSNLQFTRRGVPQIVVFFAIVGCLVLFVLSFFTILMSLFVGSAHAQSKSVFVAPTTHDKDWALGWIDYLFLGKDLKDSAGNIVASDYTIQVVLGTALSYYSVAILVLAGLLLLYHLVFMVAETAHTGKVMGRANQIWAPIRLVFAIGMLVPIAAGGGGGTATSRVTGYNTAQYIAIQIGKWGSGLAGNVWDIFLQTLQGQGDVICPQPRLSGVRLLSPSCANVSMPALDIVYTLMAQEACAASINYYANQEDRVEMFNTTDDNDHVKTHFYRGGFAYDYHTPGRKYGMDFEAEWGAYTSSGAKYDYKELCGSYEMPAIDENDPYRAVYAAYNDAFRERSRSVGQDIANFSGGEIFTSIPSAPEYNLLRFRARTGRLYNLLREHTVNFQNELKNTVENLVTGIDATVLNQTGAPGSVDHYAATGWLMAGAWFPRITTSIGNRAAALAAPMPNLAMPALAGGGNLGLANEQAKWWQPWSSGGTSASVLDAASMAYGDFMGHLQTAKTWLETDLSNSRAQAPAGVATVGGQPNTGLQAVASTNTSSMALQNLMKDRPFFEGVLTVIDQLMINMGLTEANGGLAVRFGKSANPLVEITAFGQKYLHAGATALTVGAAVVAGGAAFAWVPFAGASISAIGGLVGGLFITAASLFFMVGITLAYIVPLYPFYRFFFGGVKWIMTLFEAVVMAPLFALAHVNPYGEGLAGQYGKYGYSVAMQLLLRPVLMIFGLIAGFLLFTATLHFLNDVFYFVTRPTFAQDNVVAIMGKFVYSIIYAVLVVILANQCFRTIGLFPDVALSWLGMQGVKEEQIGDHQMLAAAGTWAAGRGVGSLTSGVSSGAKALGEAAGGGMNKAFGPKQRPQQVQLAEGQVDRMATDRIVPTSIAGVATDDALNVNIVGVRTGRSSGGPPSSNNPPEEPPQLPPPNETS